MASRTNPAPHPLPSFSPPLLACARFHQVHSPLEVDDVLSLLRLAVRGHADDRAFLRAARVLHK